MAHDLTRATDEGEGVASQIRWRVSLAGLPNGPPVTILASGRWS